ncbi:kinase-like protein [Gigaspora margarita]|uniref:Kinase-like protein n=1 Tax=Gigaspora margarita TaxID=4874 RepID=A0A8H3XBA0_GIGMA|nr:kinase-like protein [Gigaspora margarita]
MFQQGLQQGLQQVVSYVAGTSVLRQYDIGSKLLVQVNGKYIQIFAKKIYENTLLKNYEKKRNGQSLSGFEEREAVEESRTVITFATEPILTSLANLLGNTEHLSTVPDDIKNFDLDELEIQKGLLELYTLWVFRLNLYIN